MHCRVGYEKKPRYSLSMLPTVLKLHMSSIAAASAAGNPASMALGETHGDLAAIDATPAYDAKGQRSFPFPNDSLSKNSERLLTDTLRDATL